MVWRFVWFSVDERRAIGIDRTIVLRYRFVAGSCNGMNQRETQSGPTSSRHAAPAPRDHTSLDCVTFLSASLVCLAGLLTIPLYS